MPFNVTNFSISSPSQVSGGAVPVTETAVNITNQGTVTLTLANGPYRYLKLLLAVYLPSLASDVTLKLNGVGTNTYDYRRWDDGVDDTLRSSQASFKLASSMAQNVDGAFEIEIENIYNTTGPYPRVKWTGAHDVGATMKVVDGKGVFRNLGNITSITADTPSSNATAKMKLLAWGVQ